MLAHEGPATVRGPNPPAPAGVDALEAKRLAFYEAKYQGQGPDGDPKEAFTPQVQATIRPLPAERKIPENKDPGLGPGETMPESTGAQLPRLKTRGKRNPGLIKVASLAADGNARPNRSVEVCKYFNTPKGCSRNNCPFKHVPSAPLPGMQAPPRKALCHQFQTSGKCQWGDKCKFSHESTVVPPTLPCYAFAKGKCTYGDKCKYSHAPTGTAPPSASTGPSVRPIKSVTTPTERQLEMLQSRWPGITFEVKAGACPAMNPHFCLNTERLIMMCAAVSNALGVSTTWTAGDPPDILDLWGSPLRLMKVLRMLTPDAAAATALAARFHSNIPPLVSLDNYRSDVAEALGPINMPISHCKCQDVPCVHCSPVAIINIHGLYYQSPTDVTVMLRETGARMFAVVHHFDPESPAGSFWGDEAKWERDPADLTKVIMDVGGSTLRSFNHSDLSWLTQCPIEVGAHHLGADVLAEGLSQRVVTLAVSDEPWCNSNVDAVMLDFVASAQPGVWGKVDLHRQTDFLNAVRVDVDEVVLYSRGPSWDYCIRGTHTWVSKAMIAEGARYVSTMKRDADTRNLLVEFMYKKTRTVGGGRHIDAGSLHVMACLALMLHTGKSMAAMNAWNNETRLARVWNDLLAGGTLRCWHWWMVCVACVVVGLVPILIAWGVALAPDPATCGVRAENTTSFSCNSTIPWNSTNFDVLAANAPDWELVWPLFWVSAAIVFGLWRIAMPRVGELGKPLRVFSTTMEALASGRARWNTPFGEVRREDLMDAAKFEAHHSMRTGSLQARALRASVPVPQPFHCVATPPTNQLLVERAIRHPLHFTSGPVFASCHPSVPSTGPASLAAAASRLGAVYFDEDETKVIHKNIAAMRGWYTANNNANAAWMLTSGVLVWGPGATAESLEPFFLHARGRRAWDIDQSRFDSHQLAPMKELVHTIAEAIHDGAVVEPGARPQHQAAREAMRKRLSGRTAHFCYREVGKKRDTAFRLPLKQCAVTGANETSTFATLTEALVVIYILAHHLTREAMAGVRVLCCGDDTIVVFEGGFPCDRSLFTAQARALGFKVKIHAHEDGKDAVYCSSMAWPANPAGTRLILGPLPFRQLAKLGSCVNPPLDLGPDEMARAKALSMIKRGNHVPLLGTALRRVLANTVGADPKKVAKQLALMRDWTTEAVGGPYDFTTHSMRTFLDRYKITQAEYLRLDQMLHTHNPGEYLNDPVFDACLAIDCDLSGERGTFQDNDMILSSPFLAASDHPGGDDVPNLAAPAWSATGVFEPWRASDVYDWERWFTHYRESRGGAGPALSGDTRAGRVGQVLLAHQQWAAGDMAPTEWAIANTEAFVKVEALLKTCDWAEEDFAPRAVECDKEPMIALTGPYVKSVSTYLARTLAFRAQPADDVGLPMPLPEPSLPSITTSSHRARRSCSIRPWHVAVISLLLIVALVVPVAMAREHTLELRGEKCTTMPKRAKAARAQAKRQAPTRAKTPAPRRIRAQPPRPPVPPTLGPDMTPSLMPGRRPSLMAAKARAPRPPSGVQRVTGPMAYAADSDATTAAQMLAPDEAVVKGLLAGPPIPVQDGTTKFSTITKVTVGSVLATLGSTYNLRVMGTPVANASIWYGTAYSAVGAVTAGTYVAPDTSSTFASRFDSLANTGTCIYVKCTSNADIVDGSAMHASVQAVGSAMATVYGLTRAQVLQLKGIGPMRNTTDSTHRCAFQSNDWEADFGYASPTGGVSATSGCCLIDIVSTVALTYEVTCFQTWAGVPLSDNKQDVATMDFTDPAKVAIAYAAGNQAMPPTDPRRAVVPPGSVKPPSWTDRVGAGVLGVVDGVRGVFDSSKSWLERGAAGLGALRSFGTVASNFLGLFGAQEKMVRKLYSMTEEERVFLWHFARSHECPTTLEMQTAVNYYWAKRQADRGRRLTPKALEYLAAVESKSELPDLADDLDGYVVPLSHQGGQSATRLPLASPAVEGAGTGAQPAVPLASERFVFRRAPAVPAAL